VPARRLPAGIAAQRDGGETRGLGDTDPGIGLEHAALGSGNVGAALHQLARRARGDVRHRELRGIGRQMEAGGDRAHGGGDLMLGGGALHRNGRDLRLGTGEL
jgi:hypothetical protein